MIYCSALAPAAALASLKGAALVTGDPAFRPVEKRAALAVLRLPLKAEG